MIKQDGDRYSINGLPGHWHRTLELPRGYQHFNWLNEDGPATYGTYLNNDAAAAAALGEHAGDTLHLYTQHEIFYESGVLRHTRSSPNWEGGLTTFSTCKHLMRTTKVPTWEGRWLAGLCPAHCAANCLLFVGRVWKSFPSNYDLHLFMARYTDIRSVKLATGNPRGDLYQWRSRALMAGGGRYDHHNFVPPEGHTRSVETYKSSPGSTGAPPDGRVPKWWRDIEYTQRGRRPPSFVLSPCFVFSRPVLWTARRPRRAVLRMTAGEFLSSLRRGA